MILKAIFAVYFSLLIQPTLMTPLESVNVIRRDAEYLMGTLNETCSMLKNATCKNQKVRDIKLDFTVDLDKKELCATVENVFCQVDKSLKMLDHDICRNNTLSRIQESQFVKRTGKCSLPDDRTTMKEFCPKFKDYVQRLYNRC
ncbi:hypothetical protein E2320_015459 [Naja naja]|nr:hypothetical protein E2320_015459 [Naja naja]